MEEKQRWQDACATGDLDSVRNLIKEGVDTNLKLHKNYVPITLASHYGHLSIIRLLVDHGVPIDRVIRQRSVLGEASKQGWIDIIDHCVELRVSLEQKHQGGYTPLMYACRDNKVDVVDRLLQAGCNVNARSANKNTALHIVATKCGNIGIADRLILAGAELDCLNKWDNSPLSCACYYGYVEIIDRLLDLGCDINRPNVNGLTPLAHLNGIILPGEGNPYAAKNSEVLFNSKYVTAVNERVSLVSDDKTT